MMRIEGEAAMARAGAKLGKALTVGDVVLLSGELGAGKTTFARGVLAGLGFAGDAPSPSFAILLPYFPPQVRLPIAHVDLYRIDDPAEIAELGIEEWRDDGALLIEWPERLGGLGWSNALSIRIDGAGDRQRGLTADIPPAWEARWPFR